MQIQVKGEGRGKGVEGIGTREVIQIGDVRNSDF